MGEKVPLREDQEKALLDFLNQKKFEIHIGDRIKKPKDIVQEIFAENDFNSLVEFIKKITKQ